MKKLINLMCLLMVSTMIMAQSNMTNTTTITVDRKAADGKITQEIIEIEGDGADKKLAELEKDPTVTNINVEKRVAFTSDKENSEEMIKVRKEIDEEIVKIEKATGGKADVVEKSIEVHVISENNDEAVKTYKIKTIKDGKEDIMEWSGEGEMPAEMKRQIDDSAEEVIILRGKEANLENLRRTNKAARGNHNQMTKETEWVSKEDNNNKAQLGIMIDETPEGVRVTNFTDDSPAKDAGIRNGDILTNVDGKHIASMVGLLEALSPYEPGDKVKVKYMRNGKEKSAKIKLAKR